MEDKFEVFSNYEKNIIFEHKFLFFFIFYKQLFKKIILDFHN